LSNKQCNINSRGKGVRLISGLIFVIMSGVLLILAVMGGVDGSWPWITAFVLLVIGGFSMYEGWSGWCALRAMGVKTWL
jgi:hypothetical protein